MNNQWVRIFSISGAYIALLIGGAFATGQEAMQFFVGFGGKGLIGLLICGFLMIYTCFSLLKAGKSSGTATMGVFFPADMLATSNFAKADSSLDAKSFSSSPATLIL